MSLTNLPRLTSAFFRDRRTQQAILRGVGLSAGIGAGVAGYAVLARTTQRRNGTAHRPSAPRSRQTAGGRVCASCICPTHTSWVELAASTPKSGAFCSRCRDLEYDVLVHTGDFWHYESGLAQCAGPTRCLAAPRLAAFAVLRQPRLHPLCHGRSDSPNVAFVSRPRRKIGVTVEARCRGDCRAISPDSCFYVRNTPLDGRRTGGTRQDA